MKTTIIRAASRGQADYGWLKTRYTFSFADYHNPARVHFGALRVLNDDRIAGGMGFETHPHDNMEIITIMLRGELRHGDSMGHIQVIKTGEVQVMTAGKGIYHSEHNNLPDTVAELFQIWIFPKTKNLEPRYDQKWFDPELRINQWQTLVAPGGNGTLQINQSAWFSRATLMKGTSLPYTLHEADQGAFIMVIEGSASMDGLEMNERDGAEIMGTGEFLIEATTDADILVIEIPV